MRLSERLAANSIFFTGDAGAGSGGGEAGSGGSGGDGGTGSGSGTGGAGGSSGNEGVPTISGRPITQADLDRMLQTERERGQRQARTEIEQDLGGNPAEVKRLLDEARERENEKLSEVERRERDADTKITTAQAETAAAKRTVRDAEVVVALVANGVAIERENGKLVGKAARIAQLVTAGLPDDADAEAIATSFDSVKSDMPELFGDPTKQPPPRATDGVPPVGTPKQQAAKSEIEKGREEAAKHNPAPFDPLAVSTV